MQKTRQLSLFLITLELVILAVCLFRGEWNNIFFVLPLIIIPLLVELLNVREELNNLKGELNIQRRVLNERSRDLYDKLSKTSKNFEKKIIDFEEFSSSSVAPSKRGATTALLESEDDDHNHEPDTTSSSSSLDFEDDEVAGEGSGNNDELFDSHESTDDFPVINNDFSLLKVSDNTSERETSARSKRMKLAKKNPVKAENKPGKRAKTKAQKNTPSKSRKPKKKN